jgi:hypothetical protein
LNVRFVCLIITKYITKVSSCKICWNTKFNLHSIVWNVGQSLFGKTDLHWECTISVSLMILFTNIPNWLFEPKKLHCFWCFAKIQNMPLNGITYNGINCLMESNLSKFTSPKFLLYALPRLKLICLLLSFG